jgi:DNA invertase Pin-like site-specific DNA recombinase
MKIGYARSDTLDRIRSIGYARVLSQGQSLEAQVEQLTAAGCSKIYKEKASGARSDRDQLHALLKALQPGSTVIVTRLDRLARSTVDLLTVIKTIADKGCLFRSLADPWADTTTAAGKLMLTILGGLAEFERSLILSRTAEGRERAIRSGIKMGRKPILSSHQIAEVRQRKTAGESTRVLARSYGVSPNTISRIR